MTHPAITAAITAARDFADAMEAAHAALNAPTGSEVGSSVTARDAVPAFLACLPVGSQFTDRDGDTWTKLSNGKGFSLYDGIHGEASAADPARFTPLIVTHVPADAPADPLAAFKRGDKVHITGRSRYGADNIGSTGTVGAPDYEGTGDVEVFVHGTQYVYPPDRIVAVVPEPTPTRVEITTADDRERLVAAEPGIHGEGSVYISVQSYGGRCGAWLSRDEARQLAATLTAIADS